MKTKIFLGFMNFVLLTACSTKVICTSYGTASCSYAGDEKLRFYTAKITIIFPDIDRKAQDDKACKVDYPRPYPLASKVTCTYEIDAGNKIPVTANVEDIDGTRIYSCVDADGNVIVSYQHDADVATFKVFDQSVEYKCDLSTSVEEN